MSNYLTNAPQLNVKINRPYRDALRFVLLDYGEYECVAALYNGRIVDHPAATKPKDDRFFSHASEYRGVSPVEDAMIEAGIMSVVGRVTGEPDRYGQYKDEAVLTFDDEWYDSLPVLRMYYKHSDDVVADNTIDVKYIEKYRGELTLIARIKRGDYVWELTYDDTFGYEIHAISKTDGNCGFRVGSKFGREKELSLAELWMEAERYERATDEFVGGAKRTAEKYGVPFVELLAHLAGGYWYLEG